MTKSKLPAELEDLEKVCQSKGFHIVKIRGISNRKPVDKEGILYDGSKFMLHPEGQYTKDDANFISDKACDVKLLRKLGFLE